MFYSNGYFLVLFGLGLLAPVMMAMAEPTMDTGRKEEQSRCAWLS